ncbi:MAG: protein translocase subunit SecD [Chloroflexota bacterium]
MRRAGPILIVVIGLAALIVDFFPGLRAPASGDQSGGSRPIETKLGLDLQGGLRLEYRVKPVEDANGKLKQPSADDLGVIRQIVANRVDRTGVSEPLVVVQGSDRIVVEMPGIQDVDAIRDLVGQTGRLDFVPLGTTQMNQGDAVDLKVFKPLFSGDQLDSASIGANQNGQRTVDFVLKGDGAKLFGDYTKNNIGKYFAIVLDGQVISAPVIQSAIPNGRVQIEQNQSIGGFPLAEATRIVTVLQFGSLPFPIEELANTTVSPTLGDAFLHQSMLAGVIAILLVVLFMLIHYRLPGLIASGALIYYALVVYALMRLIPVTLTLAGIAGFVLSVGMAVDANILIFERMKEELRVGKSLPAATEAGFNRAWNSILDSNVSSLITATILFLFGSSTIRGFGLTLIIGVLVSMFTAITVTRTVLRLVVARDSTRKAWLYGVSESEFVARPVTRGFRGEARGRV